MGGIIRQEKGNLFDTQFPQEAQNYGDITEVDTNALNLLQDELFKRFVQIMPMACIVWDAEFRVQSWNAAAEQIFGYSAEDSLGKLGYELIIPLALQSQSQSIWSWLMMGDSTQHSIKQNLTKSGTLIICEWFNTPIRTSVGEVIILSAVQDITERIKDSLLASLAEKALHETEEHYRRIVEAASEGIWMLDAEGKTTFVNSSMAAMLGYTLEEMDAQSLFKFVDEKTRASAAANMERCRLGVRERLDVKFNRKDGSNLWAILSTTPIFDPVGQYAGALAMITDITERKQAEEQIRFQAHLLDIVDQAVIATDLGGIITYWNRRAETLYGWSAAEVVGRNVVEVTPAQMSRQQAAEIMSSLQAGKSWSGEFLVQRKDGSNFPAMVTDAPIHNAQGQLMGIIGVSTDISDRKRAEEQLREQAALLNITPDAILVRDLQGQILFWNKGAERLYGWTAELAIGQKAFELLYREMTPQLRAAQKAIANQDEWQGELRQVTRAGQEIIVASRWTLMRDEEGNPKSILVVNSDITEKKKLEAQFLRTQRMESIGTLASGIAHDLNNVLTPILASVQVLKQLLPDQRSQHLLTILETSTRRGANLVKQVLSFGRGMEGDRVTLQMGHLITEIAKLARETFPKSIEVYTDVPNNLWTLSGDVTQLHQVLMNLTVNARDAMPDGGELNITAENFWIDENYTQMNMEAKVGPYIAIAVSDKGQGIPPEILDRIFEPFFTTKELSKGTGLGLATVMTIVKSHGGFINVWSEVNQGTQFKIFLPATQTNEVLDLEKKQQKLPWGKGQLILVVDDEASICEITKNSLETYTYRVLTASDGIEAIAMYVQHRDQIDLVLIDMMMPLMDGATAIRTLQRMNPDIKIVATSGLLQHSQMSANPLPNVQAFLSKPYTTEELLKTLHEVLTD